MDSFAWRACLSGLDGFFSVCQGLFLEPDLVLILMYLRFTCNVL